MTSDRTIISLKDYDMEGEVVMSWPGYKKAQLAEARSMALAVKYVDGEQQVDLEKGYFAAMEKASQFIESAPAKITGYDSLLDFLDKVDDKCPGAGEDLAGKILSTMTEIVEGRKSPFAKSPGAVTGRSG